jgi:hypothetical protein
MFTWICPQCGREVPPSYTDCPDCAKRAADHQAAQPNAAPPPPPPTQQWAPPPQPPQYSAAQPPQYAPPGPPYAPPPPPQYQQPQYQHPQYAPPPAYQPPPPPRSGIPTWAMAILFSFAIFGVVAGIYWLVGSSRPSKPTAVVESPAAKSGGKTNPYQKYVEIAGVRFVEDARKKMQVRFVITNHSNADIPSLAGNVTAWGRTRTSEEDAAGTFAFTTDLKGYESKELTVPFTTKHKIYELPDWQNVSIDLQITSPQ